MSEINQELFKQIRDNFEKALQAKTGWGRNDIMALYNGVVAETTMAFVGGSEEEETPAPVKKKMPTAAPKKKAAHIDEDDSIEAAQEEADADMHKASVRPPKKEKPNPMEGMDRRDIRKGITPPHLQGKSNNSDAPWD